MPSTSPELSELHSAMHAISDSSQIYHLLYPDKKHTLCGFKVDDPDPDSPYKAELHVVELVPPSRKLCKQCDKMDQRRLGPSKDPTVK